MRGKPSKKRILVPDPKFGSVVVTKMINYIMNDGRKTTAERIIYDSLESSGKKLNKDPLIVLDQAIKNVGPLMEVRSHRVGGATYQVPFEVSKNRRLALALRWITDSARSKKGSPMSKKLREELISAFNNEGSAVKKKVDTHKMAEANKAFSHFAKYSS